MSKDELLKTYLEGLTNLSVFVLEKPKSNNHCIVYKRISSRSYKKLNGVTDLSRDRFQLNIYGESYGSVREVAELVIGGIDGKSSDFVSLVENNFEVKDIDNGLYVSIIDIFVW